MSPVPVPVLRRGAFVLMPLPPVCFPPVLGRAAIDARGAICAGMIDALEMR